jgi:c-di-GMP-binding flagellar brake protein YcgR
MKSEIHDFRIKSDSHCLLMGLDGVTYKALLGDLSLTGALIRLSDNVPNGLHVGEMCGLMLSDNPKLSSAKYTGRIVKLESDSVGISFNHQEHQHQKHKYSPN